MLLNIINKPKTPVSNPPVSSPAAGINTPGTGQPVQNFPTKVTPPDIAPAPPLKQQTGTPEALIYDFTFGENFGINNSNVNVEIPPGSYVDGTRIFLPYQLKHRKFYAAAQFTFTGFGSKLEMEVHLFRNNAIIAKLPFNYALGMPTPGVPTASSALNVFMHIFNPGMPSAYVALNNGTYPTSGPGVIPFPSFPEGSLMLFPGVANDFNGTGNAVLFDCLNPKYIYGEIDAAVVFFKKKIGIENNLSICLACESFSDKC